MCTFARWWAESFCCTSHQLLLDSYTLQKNAYPLTCNLLYIKLHDYHCSFVSNAQETSCRLLARWWRSQIPWARGCWCPGSGAVCSTGTAAHIEDGWRCCGGNACILGVWAKKTWVPELGLNLFFELGCVQSRRVVASFPIKKIQCWFNLVRSVVTYSHIE